MADKGAAAADKEKGDQPAEEEQTIATDLVVTKYKMAAEIVNGEIAARGPAYAEAAIRRCAILA